MRALLPRLPYLVILPLAGEIWPRLNRPAVAAGPGCGGPLSGTWCSSVALHYLAGLHKARAENLALALALGYEFFVASLAVSVWSLSRLSRSTIKVVLPGSLNYSRVM